MATCRHAVADGLHCDQPPFAFLAASAYFLPLELPTVTEGPDEAMQKVKIYTTMTCPYCHMAKQLLRGKGVAFEEIDVASDSALRAEMSRKAGGRTTVPQIWIGDTHVGGCDDLYDLDDAGKLDSLLSGPAAT